MTVISLAILPAVAYGALVTLVNCPNDPCKFNDLFPLANRLINYALIIVAPLATLSIAAGGIILLTSGGSETRREKAKEILWYAMLGLVIAFAGWLIIKTIFIGLGVSRTYLDILGF